MGKFRDGMPVTPAAVTLILCSIDRIKQILDELEKHQKEPVGEDRELIGELGCMIESASTGGRCTRGFNRGLARLPGAGAHAAPR